MCIRDRSSVKSAALVRMDRVFEFNSNIFLDDRRFERARHCEIFWNSTPSTQICLFGPANLASGRCRALAAAREFNSSTQGRYKQARFGRLVEVIDESPSKPCTFALRDEDIIGARRGPHDGPSLRAVALTRARVDRES